MLHDEMWVALVCEITQVTFADITLSLVIITAHGTRYVSHHVMLLILPEPPALKHATLENGNERGKEGIYHFGIIYTLTA